MYEQYQSPHGRVWVHENKTDEYIGMVSIPAWACMGTEILNERLEELKCINPRMGVYGYFFLTFDEAKN